MAAVLCLCLYECMSVCMDVWMHAHLVQVLLLERLVHACVEEGLEGHLVIVVYVCAIGQEKDVIDVKEGPHISAAMEVSQSEVEEAPVCCRSSPCR